MKVLAIALPIVALAAFLFWKMSQASGRAAELSESVVGPYLIQIRQGEYRTALDNHASTEQRARVSAAQLEEAYAVLTRRRGKFIGHELFIAHEHLEAGGHSFVRAKYTLNFERGKEHVAYDIAGEGAEARITRSYERPVGRDTLTPAPR